MGFALTPHKLSLCILLQVYSAPTPPFSPISFSVRQRLAFFLMRVSKSSDGFLEPTLEELGVQLKAAIGDVGEALAEQLAARFLGYSSPEDLFTFMQGLKEVLAPAPYTAPDVGSDHETLLVEQNGFLGQFLRRCIHSFNVLSFEGTCRLLSELAAYCRPALAVLSGNFVAKEPTSTQFDEYEDVEVEDEDDENGGSMQGTPSKTPRIGSSCRAFGVPLVAMEDLEMQDCTDLQDVEFGQGRSVNGGGVRDGGFSFAFGNGASREPSRFLRTTGQAESYLRDQAAVIKRELGTENPSEADAEFALIKKLAPDMHRVHYLEYLKFLHHHDYPAAISSLHRYFDYSAGRGSGSGSGNGNDSSVGRFQTGLLNLGSMHTLIGHVTQALQALSETVRIAQQNNDDGCLAHALANLCHLLSEVALPGDTNSVGAVEEAGLNLGIGSPLGMGAQQQLRLLLKRSLKRATELKLPLLVAFSRLALAKFDLKHVQKHPQLGGLRSLEHVSTCIDVCKSLRLSSYLLAESNLNALPRTATGFPGQALVPGNMLSSGRLGPSSESVAKLAGTSHLLRAASWELYGSAPMVRVCTLLHYICYSKVTSADELSLDCVMLAQNLAAKEGPSAALSALAKGAKVLPPHVKKSLRAVQLQLLHDQALNRGNIKLARVICSELTALASPVMGVDMDLKVEASYRHAQTLLVVENYSEAAAAARQLFALCYKYDMQLHVVKVLLLIADIYRRAGSPTTGLPYVLASLTHSKSLNLDLLHAEAMVTLAELWLELGMGHSERALKLVQQASPLALGHGGLSLGARTNLCLARCYLSSSDFSVILDSSLVLEPLELSIEDYEKLENKAHASEAYFLQALVFDALGQIDQRDQAAAMYQKYVLEQQDSASVVVLGEIH